MAYAMPTPRSTRSSSSDASGWRAGLAIVAGAAVAVGLGAYGRVHAPGGQPTFKVLFDSMLAFKSWFTTAAMVLAVAQVATGLRVRDTIHWPASIPLWLPDVHRLLGTLALLASLPVAYHCLWSLGFTFSTNDPRVLIHALTGCAFYGAFVTKVVGVRVDRVPVRLVPIAGGVCFLLLVVVWLTSAALYLGGRIG